MVCKFALSVTSPVALKAIARFVPKAGVIEIGAGTGYWKYVLEQLGIPVVAFDNCAVESGQNQYFTRPTKPWAQVLDGGPEKAADHGERALLLCWPPNHTTMASEALKLYPGKYVIYVGEPSGRRTGDPAFHSRLARHWRLVADIAIPRWGTHNDRLFLYERKR
jgi:hypothetical protein